METEQLKQLPKEHVKQQKTTTGISDLLTEVFREAVQEMLKAEMDNHLGYENMLPKPQNFLTAAMVKPIKELEVS